MGESKKPPAPVAGAAPALPRWRGWLCTTIATIVLLTTQVSAQHLPLYPTEPPHGQQVQRGAARIVYGSGTLRSQPPSGPQAPLPTSPPVLRRPLPDRVPDWPRDLGIWDTRNRGVHHEEFDHEIGVSVDQCARACAAGQFSCGAPGCLCININRRCDGDVDCGDGSDELSCAVPRPSCSEDGRVLCPHTGACISQYWLCDGDDDCGDYSDETHCGGQKNCTSEQFECANGLCIDHSWMCDNENDCKDNSDEMDCNHIGCAANEFQCTSNLQCISQLWQCDKQVDCVDGSDEKECATEMVTCSAGESACARGGCVRSLFRCDGDNDCGDWSDEDGCPAPPAACLAGEFKCTDNKCIPQRWRCDGEPDCSDGADERDCGAAGARSCTADEYACKDGKCILSTWVCDGIGDCAGGEDEATCTVTCEEGQHLCAPYGNSTTSSAFRACVKSKHVCDGQRDCPRGDDEDNCPTRRDCESDSKCENLCVTTHEGKKACACPPGFILAENKYSCRDIDECMYQQDPVCSQTCSNTAGSFHCGCMTGYVLRPDLRTCKAQGGSPTLLFSNRLDIRQVSLNSDKYTSLLKGLHNSVALDYHYEKQLIFWSEITLDVIRMAYINGTNVTDVIRWGLDSPGGVAVDWVHNLLFWTDAGTRRVEVATLDGRLRAVLVSDDLDKPRAIVVHPGDALVFWTDWGPNPKIERSEMDGSNRRNVINESIFWPNGLTIDYISSKLYWADAKHHVIECSNFDGKERKKIATKGLPHPFAITLFEDALYWTDWHTKSISTVNKKTGAGFQTVHSGINVPMDIHSYHPMRQPAYRNRCKKDNGGCSHLCLPNRTSRSCQCPLGFNLAPDRRTCENTPDKLLLFARKKDIRMKLLNPTNKADVDMVIPLNGIKSGIALDWDYKTNSIFWTDVEKDTIHRAYINGSQQKVIVNTNLVSPSGLAFDWITDKIYWTDAGTNRIEVANTDGSMRALLAWKNIDKPRDIVVDPIGGVMYWSDWGKNACIESAAMDGSRRRKVIDRNVTWPNGLALDLERGRLYWTDGGTRFIEHSKLDGTDRVVLISQDLQHPFGLDLFGNEVFWTDWDMPSIQVANKITGQERRTLGSGIPDLMDVRVFHADRMSGVNRCGDNNGGCSHLCLLKPGGYSCACPIGIKIEDDGKTCANGPKNYLIFAHVTDIRRLSLDTPYTVDTVLPLPPMKRAVALDVDRTNGDVYWTDNEKRTIQKGTQDGSHVQTVLDVGLRTVDGIAIDSTGRKIYWTDAGRNSIAVSELDGTRQKVLFWTDLDQPRAIALDYPLGVMFWSDWGQQARIEQSNMDGTDRKMIIDKDLVWPNGLCVDHAAGRLYWNDAKRMTIESSSLNGGERRVIALEVSFPYGLAVLGPHLYWTDWKSQGLHRADKINGSQRLLLRDKLAGLMDLRAVQTENVGENACGDNNGGCSHLCLRAPGGFSCACPTGLLFDNASLPQAPASGQRKLCRNIPYTFLYMATQKDVSIISLDTPEMWDVTLLADGIQDATAVDFHWTRQLLFYTDVKANLVRSIQFNESTIKAKTIISGNVDAPNGLAVDWIANNIYWTTKVKFLEVARLDGSSRKVIFRDLKEPRSIALFPRKGYMFWSDWGEPLPVIERAMLDGSSRKVLVKTELAFPNGLALDYKKKRLYWTDSFNKRIETSDLDGAHRVQLIPGAGHPFGLTQYREYIYWTDWYEKTVLRANKLRGTELLSTIIDRVLPMEIKVVSNEIQKCWNPCKEGNGGCSHICLFRGDNYTCACPDVTDSKSCNLVPRRWISLVPPATETAAEDDCDDKEDEMSSEVDILSGGTRGGASPAPASSNGIYVITGTLLLLKLGLISAIVFGCFKFFKAHRPSPKAEFRPRGSGVISFPNPNYSAGAATPDALERLDRRTNRFQIFKYDRSQERVLNVYTPEGASLIPASHSNGTTASPASPAPHPDGFDTVALHPIGCIGNLTQKPEVSVDSATEE